MFVQGMEGTLWSCRKLPRPVFATSFGSITPGELSTNPGRHAPGRPQLRQRRRHPRYSVLEVATILPMHYALEGGTGGYPGFVVEAARSAAEDWESQDATSTEETTKIRVVAIPTNLEIVEPLSDEPSSSRRATWRWSARGLDSRHRVL